MLGGWAYGDEAAGFQRRAVGNDALVTDLGLDFTRSAGSLAVVRGDPTMVAEAILCDPSNVARLSRFPVICVRMTKREVADDQGHLVAEAR